MTDKPKSRLRWLQFRLRTLLLIVAVLCVPLAWVGVRMNEKRQERAVIAELEKVGGTIWYDWQWEHDGSTHYSFKLNPEPTGATWLRWLLDDDFFSHVIYVSLNRANTDVPFKDDDLQLIATFSKLEVLNLSSVAITDAGLALLQEMTSLRCLDLSQTNITDAGLVHLQHLDSMRALCLDSTPITGKGLEHLMGMADLKELSLINLSITDDAMAHLKNMRRLWHLRLNGTRLTDGGLGHLKQLAALRRVDLSNVQVTDEGVAELQRHLPNCTILQ